MKKLVLLFSAALVSASLFAADVQIPGGKIEGAKSTGGSQTFKAVANDAGFVKNDFTMTTSANVGLAMAEDLSQIAVSTEHADGFFEFSGTSNGGSVTDCGPKQLTKKTDGNPTTPSLTKDNGCNVAN